MTGDETRELRRLAARHALARVLPFEDGTGLALALLRRYLATFEGSMDSYAASWDASRAVPGGFTGVEWAELDIDIKARYIGLELAQCAAAMLDRIADSEADIHDVMPDAWEII